MGNRRVWRAIVSMQNLRVATGCYRGFAMLSDILWPRSEFEKYVDEVLGEF